MLTSRINFINFKKKINKKISFQILSLLKQENNQVIGSLSKNYQNNYNIKLLKKFKSIKNFRIIGMGGSILGAETIYNFEKKLKKFHFVDNLSPKLKKEKKNS